MLSTRGTNASAAVGERLIWNIISNLWHPVTNASGYVSLGVAENALMHDELRDFLNSKQLVDAKSKALTYGDGPSGSKHVKEAVSSFFNSYFHPVAGVKLEHLFITNGVTSAIEHAALALANPGDGILLGRPYYRSFLHDIGFRTGVKVISVSFGDIDPCGPDCVTRYEEALIASNTNGVKIRALMLCHPHNPLGRCYSRGTIIALMQLCQKHEIHFISDEIYALSVWENAIDELATAPEPFHSTLSIDIADIIDPARVHVLWGTSKDFGANGLRLGVLVSQANDRFLKACETGSLFSCASSLVENAVTEVLRDEKFLANFVQTNCDRLSKAYTHAVKLLDGCGIEHMKGVNAAFFLWVDLGKKFRENHPETGEGNGEGITHVILQKLMQKKVYIVSGDAAGAEHPGWFRLVFSQPEHVVEEGVRRIAEAIS
ncbi:PLP-dependent transferase [Melanomma pulvis-pyrius CBS 109.77]|uniref:PLP-dependent transferase n=1 Tax=Melanomma pulvis-pyrius CBS 109.77 TaxID=1314802 RepID=A0A6A6X806_9PLEO|nr:PLP-dependent transferase [Melanomma pulvis-pyrius CBS 109.77]